MSYGKSRRPRVLPTASLRDRKEKRTPDIPLELQSPVAIEIYLKMRAASQRLDEALARSRQHAEGTENTEVATIARRLIREAFSRPSESDE